MILEKAHKLIAMHSGLGSGYNRNACHIVLDALFQEYDIEKLWKIKPDTKFISAFKS